MGDALAAFAAWLGVSLVVLSDGRRGLALGLAIAALGLAGLSLPAGGPAGAAALVAGGAIAAGRRVVAGRAGWAIMPAGSTPRLVLCVAGGILALWVGLALSTGDGGALRVAVMAVIGLASARVLSSDDGFVAQTAAAVLAIGIAAATALAADQAGVWPYLAAGAIAAGAAWVPRKAPRAA